MQVNSPDTRGLRGSIVGKSANFKGVNNTVTILGDLIEQQM